MVTNINLVAPESEKKTVLSGKTSLVLSVLILFSAIAAYAVVSVLSGSYLKQKNQVENLIKTENEKISGSKYADMADFQERLNLVGEILDDHLYLNSYVKNFSKYVLPEVHLLSFSSKSSGEEISLSGIAPNFDAVSREIILLKNSPIVQSVEFNSATETSGTEGQSVVSFGLTVKIKKDSLNK